MSICYNVKDGTWSYRDDSGREHCFPLSSAIGTFVDEDGKCTFEVLFERDGSSVVAAVAEIDCWIKPAFAGF